MLSQLLSAFPQGVRYMLLSALGFALMSACVKSVASYGIPVLEIVAARALVSLLISYVHVRRTGIALLGHNRKLLFARGAVGTVALMCVYYSVSTLPLAEATILQYMHPVFTAFIAVLFLKEQLQFSTLVCIVLCLSGLFCMVQPSMQSTHDALPTLSVVMALVGAFGSAVAYVLVRKLSQTEHSSVIILYFPLIALPVSLLLLFINDDFVAVDWYLTLLLILVGIFTQVGQVGLTKAMQSQTASKATAYAYVQIVFSVVIGAVVFNELPSFWTYLGGSLIVAGALFNVFGKQILLTR